LSDIAYSDTHPVITETFMLTERFGQRLDIAERMKHIKVELNGSVSIFS